MGAGAGIKGMIKTRETETQRERETERDMKRNRVIKRKGNVSGCEFEQEFGGIG